MCEEEKIILAFYGEMNEEEKKSIFTHIDNCDKCKKFYNTLLLTRNIFLEEKISKNIEKNILNYASNKVSSYAGYIKKLSLSFAFSFAVIMLFVFPLRNTNVLNLNIIDNRFQSLENEVLELSYDINFSDNDLDLKEVL